MAQIWRARASGATRHASMGQSFFQQLSLSLVDDDDRRGRHFFASLLPLSLLPYLSHPASPTLRRLPHAASPWRERRGTESRRTSRENENGSEKKTPLVAFLGDRFEKK